MRISGGTARGRTVRVRRAFSKTQAGDELRPTSAKVRKAVFDILGEETLDSAFLDLYAGTGAMGLEALSRGAAHVTLVDDNPVRVRIMKELIDAFGFSAQARVIRDKATPLLSSPDKNLLPEGVDGTFDIIFLDPPYASGEIEGVLPLIEEEGILRHGGSVIVEHASKKSLPSAVGSLQVKKRYRYGDTSLTLYKKTAGVTPSA